MLADHQRRNMRDHVVAVQEIVAALPVEDYPAIEKAVGRVGFTDPMGPVCTHMGHEEPTCSSEIVRRRPSRSCTTQVLEQIGNSNPGSGITNRNPLKS